jgi:hypothetical protein
MVPRLRAPRAAGPTPAAGGPSRCRAARRARARSRRATCSRSMPAPGRAPAPRAARAGRPAGALAPRRGEHLLRARGRVGHRRSGRRRAPGGSSPPASPTGAVRDRSRRRASVCRLRATANTQVEAAARPGSNRAAFRQTMSMVSCASSSALASVIPRRRRYVFTRGAKWANRAAKAARSRLRPTATRWPARVAAAPRASASGPPPRSKRRFAAGTPPAAPRRLPPAAIPVRLPAAHRRVLSSWGCLSLRRRCPIGSPRRRNSRMRGRAPGPTRPQHGSPPSLAPSPGPDPG